MKITWFIMPPGRIRHIAKHSVTPEEVEQVAYEDRHHIVQRLKVIFIYKGHGRAYLVTARDMTPAERRYYLAKRH
ncbi:MAG: hypothetical protein PWP41_1800 [Moorella sp. (in: firmicutes)]|nr:hypothetical protein [Moorella sp. (in: firmicutes)]